jgi:hypothetical protein
MDPSPTQEAAKPQINQEDGRIRKPSAETPPVDPPGLFER